MGKKTLEEREVWWLTFDNDGELDELELTDAEREMTGKTFLKNNCFCKKTKKDVCVLIHFISFL